METILCSVLSVQRLWEGVLVSSVENSNCRSHVCLALCQPSSTWSCFHCRWFYSVSYCCLWVTRAGNSRRTPLNYARSPWNVHFLLRKATGRTSEQYRLLQKWPVETRTCLEGALVIITIFRFSTFFPTRPATITLWLSRDLAVHAVFTNGLSHYIVWSVRSFHTKPFCSFYISCRRYPSYPVDSFGILFPREHSLRDTYWSRSRRR